MDELARRVQVHALTKRFGRQEVLRGVSFAVGPGEVVALAGANGAGKSTTVKILSGIESSDSGSIHMDGAPVTITSPDTARSAGIGIVHQDPGLLLDMTVLENFALRRGLGGKRGVIDWDSELAAFEAAVAVFDEPIDPHATIETLPIHIRQVVAVTSELAKQIRLLILDEVTALLSDSEVRQLFRVLRRLKVSDVAILMITHRSGEVFDIADRVVVLRDGVVAASGEVAEFTEESLAEAITGRRLQAQVPRQTRGDRPAAVDGAAAAVELDQLRLPGLPGKVTATINPGECVGLAGLAGHGQSGILSSIFGLQTATSGTVRVFGEDASQFGPRRSISRGIGYLARDRATQSVVPDLSVGENISLPWVANRYFRWPSGAIRRRREGQSVHGVIDTLKIKCRGFGDDITSLSGGNQQKAILGRWLIRPVKVMLLDEPTHGVDIATKNEIYELIRAFTAGGGTVLVASAEFEEFKHMCDRILVLRAGAVVAEFPGDVDVESLYIEAYGTQGGQHAAAAVEEELA